MLYYQPLIRLRCIAVIFAFASYSANSEMHYQCETCDLLQEPFIGSNYLMNATKLYWHSKCSSTSQFLSREFRISERFSLRYRIPVRGGSNNQDYKDIDDIKIAVQHNT
jgi:hypothetical protein